MDVTKRFLEQYISEYFKSKKREENNIWCVFKKCEWCYWEA